MCAHRGKCCALIGWPAIAESIKGMTTSDRLHSWGVAREDDMTDWELNERPIAPIPIAKDL